jgi:hypothetical protein
MSAAEAPVISLFEDRRGEMLHVHLPGGYNVCNYRCTYCYLPAFNPRLAPGIVGALNRILDRLTAVQRPMNVVFATDGEITVSTELWPLLARLPEIPSVRLVTLFSNCSGNFDNILARVPPGQLSVIASCHLQQMDSEARVQRFLRTVEKLSHTIRAVVVSVILEPAQMSRFPRMKQELDQRGVSAYAYPIIQVEGRTRPYTGPERELAVQIMDQTNPARVINEMMLERTFPGLRCAAGRDYIQIDNDGTVVACWRTRQVLGNLLADDPPRLLGTDSPCPFGGCACNWTAGFSDAVTRDFRRVNSLYNFVPHHPGRFQAPSFVLESR